MPPIIKGLTVQDESEDYNIYLNAKLTYEAHIETLQHKIKHITNNGFSKLSHIRAPTLETILHQTFKQYEINKVNSRKEFFKLPLEEIKKVVMENHNATVNFIMEPEAEEYMRSLQLSEAI